MVNRCCGIVKCFPISSRNGNDSAYGRPDPARDASLRGMRNRYARPWPDGHRGQIGRESCSRKTGWTASRRDGSRRRCTGLRQSRSPEASDAESSRARHRYPGPAPGRPGAGALDHPRQDLRRSAPERPDHRRALPRGRPPARDPRRPAQGLRSRSPAWA